ncbi:hypothetical protein [Peribacillus simplex]|uniref:hypothetical protein n=1 Tax=Peribacillus simplex TaxID=1478 RepID=UPI003CFD6A26
MTNRVQANKDFITEALRDDALFTSLVLDKEYSAKLFKEDILELDPNAMYSTTDCSDKIFNIANSTLRYYVRMLEGYLEIYVEGRKKRLPFLTVFKIHMTLLSIERGETISDIQVKLSLKSIPQQNDGKAKGSKYNEDTLDQLFSEFDRRQNVMMRTLTLQNTINLIEVELLRRRTGIADRQRQIEVKEEKIKNHRLNRKMDRQAANVLRKSLEQKKNTGFFSFFAKKRTEDTLNIESDILVDERDIKADHIEVELIEEINAIRQKISQMEEESLALEKRLKSETALLTNEREVLEQTMED